MRDKVKCDAVGSRVLCQNRVFPVGAAVVDPCKGVVIDYSRDAGKPKQIFYVKSPNF